MIEAKRAEYLEKGDKSITRRKAESELVNNALEAVQDAENFAESIAETMAELGYSKSKAEGILQSIKDFFVNLKNAITSYLNKKGSDKMITAEGKYMAKHADMEFLDNLLKLYNQGMREVRNNYDAYVRGERSGEVDSSERYSFEGYAEDGKGKYKGAFPKGTPKKAKAEQILHYIQNVWSKKPIRLVINENGNERVIYAHFDPTYDATYGTQSDASKLMGGNRHGTAAEQRVTLDLSEDYYQILSEASYNYSKEEVGKSTIPHEQVKMWHYFVNDVYFSEKESDTYVPYRVTINVKEKADGAFVYSFSAEKAEKFDTQQTLHAAVSGNNATNVKLSDNSISEPGKIVNSENTEEDHQFLGDETSKAAELERMSKLNRDLQKRNDAQADMIKTLRRQIYFFNRGDFSVLNHTEVQKMAKQLIKNTGAKVSSDVLGKRLSDLYDMMAHENSKNADKIQSELQSIATELVNTAEAINIEAKETLEGIKHLAQKGIRLAPDQRGDVLHRYDTMSDYMKSVKGLKFRNDGVWLDDLWSEFCAAYPNYFDSEI